MSSSAPLSGTDFLAKPRKLVLQLIGLAAKNLPNVISKLEERVDRHRSKIAFDHFPPPTRCQHSLLPQQKMNLMVSKRKRVYTTLVIASGLPILSECAVVAAPQGTRYTAGTLHNNGAGRVPRCCRCLTATNSIREIEGCGCWQLGDGSGSSTA